MLLSEFEKRVETINTTFPKNQNERTSKRRTSVGTITQSDFIILVVMFKSSSSILLYKLGMINHVKVCQWSRMDLTLHVQGTLGYRSTVF